MKNSICSLCFIFATVVVFAQYPPAAGEPGSTAIPADSSCFVAWANDCHLTRGYVNMSDTTVQAGGSNKASYGTSTDAHGQPDNLVVSLGDRGEAILTFEFPIVNGPGWDFAVFENSLNNTFLEFAFVEVSSNGSDFFRFPAVSLTQTDVQTGSFGETDPTKIHNLAGKYRSMFGMPFNLEDIADDPLLDKNNITHVKIIDVGGSIDPPFASYDDLGNMINDPFPTPFESCGFDLDAVGVIHNTQTMITDLESGSLLLYPNPVSDMIHIPEWISVRKILIINDQGQCVFFAEGNHHHVMVSDLASGFYIMHLQTEDGLILNALLIRQ
jgi:hypothetical protein